MSRVNIWVILAAMLVAGGLIVVIVLALFLSPTPAPADINPGAVLTIIPAPTPTATPTMVLETPTATAPPSVGGVSVGSYVQISGTEGQGLRLRSGPGTGNPPRFLGMDAEVFQVKDGPKDSDGFTWWYLEAPYDPERSGWAASSFLTVVNNPTETP
ncbi:MAG: hypothetical protein IH586_21035 [Anaerolineaceae bacterium]|nr:hypothetical protein [Anaerolineaceae bacterium]